MHVQQSIEISRNVSRLIPLPPEMQYLSS